MKQLIPVISLALIITGILILLAYFIPKNEVSGSFVIVLFFIPISGSFGKYGDILLILLVTLTILILLINFISVLRKRI
jgi:hypothetical protein